MSTTTEKLEPAVIRAGVVIILGTVMSILDSTIVAVALHTLGHDFHVTVNAVQWVTTGYLLALATVIPLSGWAVHRFGAKPVYLASLGFFVAGSALCGLAWSAPSLIFFRVLQGLGGGMILPVGQAIMARLAGPHRMAKVMSIIGVPQLLGPILGPVIGGIIISNYSWRWIFFVNVPIGIVALWLAKDFLPRSTPDGAHRFDTRGFFLLSPGLAILVYGLSSVGTAGGFHGRSVWLGIGIGTLLTGLFVWHALREKAPLLELHLLKDRTFAWSSVSIFLTGATLYGTMFLLPLYYQIDRGLSAWQAGLMMAPQGVGAAAMMRLSGSIADRKGPRYVAPIGMILLAVGTFFYTQVSASSNYALLLSALFVRGIGLGFGMMPVFASSYRNLTHEQVPKATTATNIFRQVGGSLGVAVFAAELQSQFITRLGPAAAALQNGVVRPTTSQLAHIAQAFSHSFWLSFGVCVIGFVPTLFLPNTGSPRAAAQSAK